jgi:hypothetical protein
MEDAAADLASLIRLRWDNTSHAVEWNYGNV